MKKELMIDIIFTLISIGIISGVIEWLLTA